MGTPDTSSSSSDTSKEEQKKPYPDNAHERERERKRNRIIYRCCFFVRFFFFSSCNISRTLVCLRLACLFRCICGNENDDDDLHQQRAHRMKRMIQLLFSLRSRRVIVFPFFSLNCTTQGLCAGRTQMRTSASASSTASN